MPNPRVDIIIGAQTEEFAHKLKKTQRELDEGLAAMSRVPGVSMLREALTNPITLATAAIGAMVKGFEGVVRNAEKLQSITARIGGTLREAQTMQVAAGMTGVPEETLMSAVGRLRENVGQALGGDKSMLKEFQALGLTEEDLAKQSPLTQLTRITKLFESGKAGAIEYAAANRVLGRSFDDLLPAIERGLGSRLEKPPGIGVSTQDVRTAREVGQASTSIWQAIKNAGYYYFSQMLSGTVGLGRITGGSLWDLMDTLGVPGAKEKRDELLTSLQLQYGPDTQSGIEEMTARLTRQREYQRLLSGLRAANAVELGMQSFGALPAAERLAILRRVQSAGTSALPELPPIQREQQMAALLKLASDIRDELRKLNSEE
jgi:hypothetical protein